ncbi:MAG: nitroreductase family protein [Magnetococcales bacterium]|nr:nitroreductase family protein [Magnetococcales bacterium]
MSATESMGRRVLAYHEHSKHHPQRFAPGPGHLDWANQPDPFRTYAGAPQVRLPLVADRLTVAFEDLYRPPAGEGDAAVPLNLESVAALLELSLGLSAWKVHGDSRWALRCNPSSGNLHPTEGYLVVPALPANGAGPGLDGGVYHYVSRDHLLEQRRGMDPGEAPAWNRLFPAGQFLIGLTSIHWREAWKYGDRAYRYCQLDIGHGVAALRYAAAALGWQARLLTAPATRDVARLLGVESGGVRFGVNDAEPEHADLLLQIAPMGEPWVAMSPKVASLVELAGQGPWMGRANRLSRRHGMEWPLVDEMAETTRQPWQVESRASLAAPLPRLAAIRGDRVGAATLIRQRRSAQQFDPGATLDREDLWRLLDATLPRSDQAPWDALPWSPRVFPVVVIHRVPGVEAGLYVLVRDPERVEALRAALDGSFLWSRVEGAPEHLPFFRLRAGDFQESAYWISCRQEIASDSALTMGMLTTFPPELANAPWIYRQLYWEAGMVGQTLYLEAEAVGQRGTGIGCFLDDGFHQLIGLRSEGFQSLYHFTLGRPVIDSRLSTDPPYPAPGF